MLLVGLSFSPPLNLSPSVHAHGVKQPVLLFVAARVHVYWLPSFAQKIKHKSGDLGIIASYTSITVVSKKSKT